MSQSRLNPLLPPKPLGLASVLGAATLAAGLVIGASMAPAQAVTFGFSNITNNKTTDAGTGENQLFVDVTDSSGGENASATQVLFTFRNTGPLPSSITRTYFDDSDDGTLFDIISITDSGDGVDFSEGANPPVLPGGNDLSVDFTADFSAGSNAPVQPNGVNPGEFASILFNLENGNTFADTLAALQGSDLRIGIHVQGFALGGSESFVNNPQPIPEPASMLGIMAFGALGGGRLLRKKKQQSGGVRESV